MVAVYPIETVPLPGVAVRFVGSPGAVPVAEKGLFDAKVFPLTLFALRETL